MSGEHWLRRHGTTVVLVVVAAVLAAAVWMDRAALSGAAGEGDRATLFGSLEPERVVRVAVVRGDSRVELRRAAQDGGSPSPWQLRVDEEPHDADSQSVMQLLTTLSLARAERPVDDVSMDRSLAGLDHPELRIELELDGRAVVLAVGADAPTPPGSRYAETSERRAGSPEPRRGRIVVVSRELVQSLEDSTGKLRARTLVAGAADGVTEVILSDADGAERWRLAHVPDWGRGATAFRVATATAPDGVRADWRTLEPLLGALRELALGSFLKDSPAEPTGAVGAGLTLTVRTGAPGATTELAVGGACHDGSSVRVTRSKPTPMGGCVGRERLRAIDVPAARLIDRHVVGAADSLVVEVKLSDGEHGVEVARRGTGWFMRSPREGDADADAVDAWLTSLLELSGEVVHAEGGTPQMEAMGLVPPAVLGRVVSIRGAGGSAGGTERIESFEVGRAVDQAVYVRRLEDGAVVRLQADAALAPLSTDGQPLRDLTVLDVSVRRIVGVTSQAKDIRQRIDRSGDDATWKLVEPSTPGLDADAALVSELVERLARLRALQWVDGAAAGTTGLEAPWCTLDVRVGPDSGAGAAVDDDESELSSPRRPALVGPEASVIRIELGRQTRGGYFARTSLDGVTFVAPRAPFELGCGWLLDRGALLFDSRKVTKVTLRAEGRGEPIVVTQSGGRWEAVQGALPRREAESVVPEVLDGLFAEGVVRVGPPGSYEQLDRPQLVLVIERAEGAAGPATATLRVGAGDSWRSTSVYYLRREGLPATFAVAQAKLRPLLDLF